MNDIFKGVDTSEILTRYANLIQKYTLLAQELAPKIEKFGKYRQELQQITIELVDRNIKIEDPQALHDMIESEMQKRDIEK